MLAVFFVVFLFLYFTYIFGAPWRLSKRAQRVSRRHIGYDEEVKKERKTKQ